MILCQTGWWYFDWLMNDDTLSGLNDDTLSGGVMICSTSAALASPSGTIIGTLFMYNYNVHSWLVSGSHKGPNTIQTESNPNIFSTNSQRGQIWTKILFWLQVKCIVRRDFLIWRRQFLHPQGLRSFLTRRYVHICLHLIVQCGLPWFVYLSVVSVEIYAMKEAASIGEKTKEGSFVFLCVFL